MKVVFFTRKLDKDDPRIGFAHLWAKELAKRLEKVHVVCLGVGRVELPDNVEVHPLGKGRLRRFLRYQWLMLRLGKRVDAIFCHMNPIYAIISAPMAKLYRKRLVMWYAHGGISWRLKLAIRLCDRILTSSKSGLRIETKKARVVGQGIDTERFKPAGVGRGMLSVGRISRVKGYETLIKALPGILAELPKTELRIVGGAELEDEKAYLKELAALSKELKVDKSLEFVDGISFEEMPKVYSNCKLFVSDSQTGSLDKVVLEAMSSGRLVLTSNPGFRDILKEFGGMMMFRKRDEKEFCEKAIVLLSLDEKARERASRRLREIVASEHSLGSLMDRIVKSLY